MALREIVRQIVPLSVRKPYVEWKTRRAEASGPFFCPVCKSSIRQFLTYGDPPLPDDMCPVCQSKACHRLAWACFAEQPDLFVPKGMMVHIAPEYALSRWLKRRCKESGMTYMQGDIRDPHHYLDIMDLSIPDRSVDLFFACHVLNMLPEDRKALREIYRVLKPGGVAVLPVPIRSEKDALVEPDPNEGAAARFESFNDPHMFRAYTDSVLQRRLEMAGFSVDRFCSDNIQNAESEKWKLQQGCIHIALRGEDS